jgi:hypothetical protein
VILVTTFTSFLALTRNENTLFTTYSRVFLFSAILAAELGNVRRSIHLALVEILSRIIEIRVGAGRGLPWRPIGEPIYGHQHDVGSLDSSIGKT